MEQLSGLDGMFLQAELDGLPMTISPVTIYDPSTAPQGTVRFKDILKVFEDGLHKASLFRRRVVPVPMNLDHAYWIEDPDFDIEYHVRHVRLPRPGDWRQFYIQIARLQSLPIDRSRPLWEAYVIEGLDHLDGIPPGCFAILLKIHHVAMDGVTGVEVFTAMHDFEPRAPGEFAPERPLIREHRPGAARLLVNTAGNYWKRTLATPRLLGKMVGAYRRIQSGRRHGEFHVVEKRAHTRFNGLVTPGRTVCKMTMPLIAVKQIKNSVSGATVNDVMLTVIGGALRRYLQAKEELPETTLVAGCPVDVRTDANRHVRGNILSIMNVALRTDIEDPMERLRAVHAESAEAKAFNQAMGPTLVTDLTQVLPPFALAAGVRAYNRLATRTSPVHHTIVTNVPGLPVAAYFAGARLVDSFGLGPCLPNCGLFHTVTSLLDTITVAVTACRDMLPDPAFYEGCLRESWQKLESAALKTTAAA